MRPCALPAGAEAPGQHFCKVIAIQKVHGSNNCVYKVLAKSGHLHCLLVQKLRPTFLEGRNHTKMLDVKRLGGWGANQERSSVLPANIKALGQHSCKLTTTEKRWGSNEHMVTTPMCPWSLWEYTIGLPQAGVVLGAVPIPAL